MEHMTEQSAVICTQIPHVLHCLARKRRTCRDFVSFSAVALPSRGAYEYLSRAGYLKQKIKRAETCWGRRFIHSLPS